MLCAAYNKTAACAGFADLAADCESILDLFKWYRKAEKPITEKHIAASLRSLEASAVTQLAKILSVKHGTPDRLCGSVHAAFLAFDSWSTTESVLEDAVAIMHIIGTCQGKIRFEVVPARQLRSYFRKYGFDLLRSPASCQWKESFADFDKSHALELLFAVLPKAHKDCPHNPDVVLALRDSVHGIDEVARALHADCMAVIAQSAQQRLPCVSEAPDIHKRIVTYKKQQHEAAESFQRQI